MEATTVDSMIEELNKKSDSELKSLIGTYALGPHPLSTAFAAGGKVRPVDAEQVGDNFLQSKFLKELICGPSGIRQISGVASISDIIGIVSSALGLSGIGTIPMAIIGLAILIVRTGMNVYCEDYNTAATNS